MSKTPKQMAREYAITRELFDPHRITFDSRLWLEQGFLAGYQAAKDQLADAGKVMNSPEKLDSWISVKDRLPEDGEQVLGFLFDTVEIGSIDLVLTDPGHFHWNAVDRHVDKGHQFLTHWMPLPEAPKGEG